MTLAGASGGDRRRLNMHPHVCPENFFQARNRFYGILGAFVAALRFTLRSNYTFVKVHVRKSALCALGKVSLFTLRGDLKFAAGADQS